jgi:NtrC-family two-component system sensor histidine kinase KinB
MRDQSRHRVAILASLGTLALLIGIILASPPEAFGGLAWVLLGLAIVFGSLAIYYLAITNQRLDRRVKELEGLQASGQALSARLDVDAIVAAIYAQVAELVPAQAFFVALYDPPTEQLSFPLAIEEGQQVQWPSRRPANGLIEYVLRTQEPLLIRENVKEAASELGLEPMRPHAACWLGVPMKAGTEALGVIGVQSRDRPKVFRRSHQRVLVTIAAQAAVALQNARLHALADESLARRVQELDSILRSTRDGILLLDLDWRVVTVNRTLADWAMFAPSELDGKAWDTPLTGGDSLMRWIGYSPGAMQADCETLTSGQDDQKQAIVLLGPTMRHVQRTLIPVRGQDETITGWLLVFRDMTEEMELARLKDDMTDMLVHDLRSPLTALMGSLALMQRAFDNQDARAFANLWEMAQQGSDRIMHIVNQLLDISRLESGQLPVQPETIEVAALFKDVASRFTPQATDAHITLESEAPPEMPPLQADPSLINRVLDNLLDNAIKFTPDGGEVKLWARCDAELAPDEMLLGVSDTGPGIPPEAQARLFSKFQQISSIQGRRSGTGLGLAFCKLAVEAHGGHIWVDSVVGEGSAFIMALPTSNEGVVH